LQEGWRQALAAWQTGGPKGAISGGGF
jgi:hypothetical protein